MSPYTKNAITIYFEDIYTIKVTKVKFNPTILIYLTNEDEYYKALSLFNKIKYIMNRWTGFPLFTLNPKSLHLEDRVVLLDKLEEIRGFNLINQDTVLAKSKVKKCEKDFMKKYSDTPPVDKRLGRSYFKKRYIKAQFYLYSLLFLFIYLLIKKMDI